MRKQGLVILATAGLAAPASAQLSRTVVYGDTTTNIPRVRTWSGSAWSAAAATLDIGGSPRWVVVDNCPIRSEMIAAVGDSQDDLNVMVYNGSAWGSLLQANSDIGTDSDRAFCLAYEQASGDALLAYRVGNTDSTLYYRTWDGTSWSSESSTSYSGSGNPRYIKLVPKPDSNEIMALVLDSKKDVSALVWNGTSWGNKTLLDNNAQLAGSELMDAAYERVSGRCLVVWSVKNTGTPSYEIWNGSSWGSELLLPSIGGKGDWARLAADPASNKIIAMFLDTSADVNVVEWSGSTWGSVTELETSASATDRRAIDVAFEPAGTRAIAAYGTSSQDYLYYRTYSGSSWSAEQTGPNLSDPVGIVQLSASGSGQEILIGVETKNDGALAFMRWTGSTIADYQTLASDLGGPNSVECFMFSPSVAGSTSTPRIVSWQEVDPGS